MALVPVQTSAPQDRTLSDGHLLNSLLLSEIKKEDIFLAHLHPFPPTPTPRKDCRNRTMWCCPSPLLRLLDGGMSLEHLEKEKKRAEAERNEGGSVYRNIVIKKRKLLIMEYNKKKKTCGSFCHFLFLFDVIIIVYFGGSIFPRWHSVSTYIF